MTQEERTQVATAWLTLAQIYGKDVPPQAMTMMINAVSDLPVEKVLRAIDEWSRVSKQPRHPFPAEVRDLAGAGVSLDAEATAAATRIQDAITKFGYMRGTEARVYVGTLGWEVVRRFGGWQRVCEMVGVDYDKSAFLAHAKSIAKSEAEYARAGRHNEAPQLPEPPPRGGGLVKASDIGRLLPSREGK